MSLKKDFKLTFVHFSSKKTFLKVLNSYVLHWVNVKQQIRIVGEVLNKKGPFPWESEILGQYFMLWWMPLVLNQILHLKQTEKE